MLKNALTIAWRRLLKDRRFTLLNGLGLSTGLACVMLIYCWTSDELAVDKYSTSDARLYQVFLNSPSTGQHEITTADYTPGLLATTLTAEFPEVEAATAVVTNPWHDKKGLLSTPTKKITANGVFIGNDFFRLFTLPLIAGNKEQPLPARNDIVISESLAFQLFNTTNDCIGKTVEWTQNDYTGLYRITAIFQKPPANATLQFDLALNYDLFLDKNQKLLDWQNNDPSTFVLLKQNADPENFNKKIAGLIKAKAPNSVSTLFAQKYSDHYLHGVYANGRPAGGRIQYVHLFSLIALFILLIACINFMNLSTAKAAGRIKESGIKKVIGASRATLIVHYLVESLLLTTLASILAIGLAALALPAFDQITGKQLHLVFNATFGKALITITGLTGLLSGSYPALYCSSFKPAPSLTGKLPASLSELLIRKGLVVFQFTLSSFFILAVLVVHRQMDLIQTKNLGYDRTQLLYFRPAFETVPADLAQQVRNIPGVLDAANFGQNITNRDGGTYDISWPGKDPDAKPVFTDLSIGPQFIETAHMKLRAGRSFSPSYGNEKASVIFNQTAIRLMRIKDPIGKTVHIWGTERQIVGIVEDFHFQSLHEPIKPCFFECNTSPRASNIMVRIAPGAEHQTVEALGTLYRKISGGLPLEYHFLDEDYHRLYFSETRTAALAKYFAALAICISGLGLFGLAAFTAQKKQKEIGIRKTIGAGTGNILGLLSREFLLLTGLGLLVGLPIAAWVMTGWLHSFAYCAPLNAYPFLVTAMAALVITAVSIGWQCLRAATQNPITALRSE